MAANIKDGIRHHKSKLNKIEDKYGKLNRLEELIVLVRIENIKQNSVYKQAVESGIKLKLSAWVFAFNTGPVHDFKKKSNIIPSIN